MVQHFLLAPKKPKNQLIILNQLIHFPETSGYESMNFI